MDHMDIVHEFEFYGGNKKSVASNMSPENRESSQIEACLRRTVPIRIYICIFSIISLLQSSSYS